MKTAKIVIILGILFVGMISFAEAAGKVAGETKLQVGLWENQTSVMISCDRDFVVRDAANQSIVRRYPAKAKVFVAWKDKSLYMDDLPVKVLRLDIEPEDAKSREAAVEVNRKSYRGVIRLQGGQTGITVINAVGLEEYLYGVVPGEMPDDWSAEALKAQAVAARTFALYNLNKHQTGGFDLCASTHCQVYGGRSAEKANATAAVDATCGQVVLYKSKPICALFHTTSGGLTENSEDVWGSYLPYLRSVQDDDNAAPAHRWNIQLSPQQLALALQSAGYSIGTLQAIELSPLSEAGGKATDRSATGRVRSMRFIGDKGSVCINGAKVRSLLGLKSTFFDIAMIVPEAKKIDVPIGPHGRKEIAVDLPVYKEKGLYTDSENIRRISGRSSEMLMIDGRGWGHGLGLSQWGAEIMGKAGQSYEEILRHYYTGVEIKKLGS